MDRLLSIGKNKKVIGLMKGEVGGQIMKKFVGLRAKTYSYLKDNNDEDKNAKWTKECVIKGKIKFRGYMKCLNASQIKNIVNYLQNKQIDADSLKEIIKFKKVISKTQQKFKSERHNIFTEEIIKIALSSSDDKRMQ